MTFLSNTRILTILLTSVLVAGILPFAAGGHARTFTYKSIDYVVEFPSAGWRAVGPSGLIPARTRTEFAYADENGVRLIVRKKMVDSDVTPSDMVSLRQGGDGQLAGYVTGREESFDGRLSGTKFSYGYTLGGTPMSGLIYYLEADARTVYSLHFTGTSGAMRGLSGQMDSIARSFRLR